MRSTTEAQSDDTNDFDVRPKVLRPTLGQEIRHDVALATGAARTYTTSATGSMPADIGQESLPVEENVVAQVCGVALNATREQVLVRLQDPELVVHFPRDLFDDEKLLLHGTPLLYQIVE